MGKPFNLKGVSSLTGTWPICNNRPLSFISWTSGRTDHPLSHCLALTVKSLIKGEVEGREMNQGLTKWIDSYWHLVNIIFLILFFPSYPWLTSLAINTLSFTPSTSSYRSFGNGEAMERRERDYTNEMPRKSSHSASRLIPLPPLYPSHLSLPFHSVTSRGLRDGTGWKEGRGKFHGQHLTAINGSGRLTV